MRLTAVQVRKGFLAALAAVIAAAGAAAAQPFNLKDHVSAKFSKQDKQLFDQALDEALNSTDGVYETKWTNRQTGTSGYLAVLEPFQEGDRTCRKVKVENYAAGESAVGEFKLCMQADGKWRVPPPPPAAKGKGKAKAAKPVNARSR